MVWWSGWAWTNRYLAKCFLVLVFAVVNPQNPAFVVLLELFDVVGVNADTGIDEVFGMVHSSVSVAYLTQMLVVFSYVTVNN